MLTDCAFTKGYSHDICQDYATTYSPNGYPQIILCDGCSSSKMTDIGARVLAHVAAANISNYNKMRMLIDLKRISFDFRFNDYSYLDATLLTAVFYNEMLCLRFFGDGFVVIKYNDCFSIHEFIYDKGYPFYFSYYLEKNRLENFLKINEGNNCIENCFLFGLNFNDANFSCQKFNQENHIRHINNFLCIEYIAFISDGLNSFMKKENTGTSIKNTPISKFEVLKKLLNFKNFKGKFVQRRLNAFKKECQELGWDHYDDLSIAVMANK